MRLAPAVRPDPTGVDPVPGRPRSARAIPAPIAPSRPTAGRVRWCTTCADAAGPSQTRTLRPPVPLRYHAPVERIVGSQRPTVRGHGSSLRAGAPDRARCSRVLPRAASSPSRPRSRPRIVAPRCAPCAAPPRASRSSAMTRCRRRPAVDRAASTGPPRATTFTDRGQASPRRGAAEGRRATSDVPCDLRRRGRPARGRGRRQVVLGRRRRERDGATWSLPKGTPDGTRPSSRRRCAR